MSKIYKCDFFATTTENKSLYPAHQQATITGEKINGVDVNIILGVEIEIPAGAEDLNASPAAWKQAAAIIKRWLNTTFP